MGLIDREVVKDLATVEEYIRQQGIRSEQLKTDAAVDAILDRLNVSPFQRDYIRDEVLWGAESGRYD